MYARWPLATVLLGALIGCGGGGGDSADAAPVDGLESLCPVPPGRSQILSRMEILPPDQGFDLDGDEVIDNELSNMPASALETLDQAFHESISVGELMLLFHVSNWTNPPTATDPDIVFDVFTGIDADVPADASNNISGVGRFYVRVSEFDLDCNSNTSADQASLEDYVLSATRSRWAFELSVGTGTMEFDDAILEMTFAPDFSSTTSLFGATMSLCSLSAMPFPGDTPGTVLDAFVNDPTFADLTVDMDMDGDGFEKVIGDGVTVLQCEDGDGTIIPGRDCACHPEIADGYSVGIRMESVSAFILGVR